MKVKIKKVPKAQQGISISNIDNSLQIDGPFQQLTPDMIKLNGERHSNGGQDIAYGGTPVEAEGTEVLLNRPNGDITVLGNAKVPGTNKTFKAIGEDLANKQIKANNYANIGSELVNNNDPYDKWQSLKFNAGRAMLEGGRAKVQQLKQDTEHLATMQQALLSVANDLGAEPIPLSKGKIVATKDNIAQYKSGGNLPKAQAGTDIGTLNNNPGNIKYIPNSWMTRGFKASKSKYSEQADNTPYATFPDLQSGLQAIEAQLRRPLYNNLTVDKAIKQWTGNKPYSKSLYANIANKKISDLSDNEMGSLVNAITQGETSKNYRYVPNTNHVTEGNSTTNNVPSNNTPSVVPINPQDAITPTGNLEPVTVSSKRSAVNNNTKLPTYGYTRSERQIKDMPFQATQILPELYAMGQNTPQGVFQQNYQPDLYTPYQVSFQDRINDNNQTFNALRQNAYIGDNPTALATMAGQLYDANNRVRADEFRTNQGIANDITNRNVSLLNEAQRTNLALQDQAYVRQNQAASNTRELNYGLLNSITNKINQWQVENESYRRQQPLYDYTYNGYGYETVDPNQYQNLLDSVFQGTAPLYSVTPQPSTTISTYTGNNTTPDKRVVKSTNK